MLDIAGVRAPGKDEMDAITGSPAEVQVKVILRERNTEALVRLEPPMPVAPTVIQNALQAHGVCYGIDNTAVLQVAQYPSTEPVIVAQGVVPQPGVDGKITYHFRGG